MNVLVRCPAHDEETTCKEERPNHHGDQPCFWDHFVIIGNHTLAVIGLAPDVDSCCEANSDYDSEEGKRADHFVPATDL